MEKLSMIIFHIILNTHVASFLKGIGGGGADLPNKLKQINKIFKQGGGEGKSASWQTITQIFLKILFP